MEEISGKKETLDGAYETGEILSLTEKGKKILDGYRVEKGESLNEFKKSIYKNSGT